MKIYISADIEGISGVTHWDETEKSKADHKYYADEMTREVEAACIGAIEAGASEIYVKDAHDSGRNIDHSKLPKQVKLIRGWSGHPFSMVQRLDESFDSAIFIGYHSYSSSSGNPLSHTMNPKLVDYIKINDEFASEFLIHGYVASYVGVPVSFVSGDKELTNHIKTYNSNILTLALKEGIGKSTTNIHPQLAYELTKSMTKDSLKSNLKAQLLELPSRFKVEINYKNHFDAYRYSFYPGAKKISDTAILFETDDYFEVLRMMNFTI
ncbi:MAG: M55 family metallopeptidase [Clostridiaceae bacterium]